MSELARLAKVNVSTVSRALADSPRVKPATKERVRQIAQEVGYEIDVSARRLRTGATQSIGVVVPVDPVRGQSITDPFYLELLGAVAHAASRRGYDVLLSVRPLDHHGDDGRMFRPGTIDAVVAIGQAGQADQLEAVASEAEHLVVWGGLLDTASYTVVGSDNVGGGRMATKHLLSLRRRRILFVGDTAHPEIALRYQGLQEAHQAAGSLHPSELHLPLSFGATDAHSDVGAFIDSGAVFDAVFAASDLLAIAAMRALIARGLRVPEDVAVVGYDNIGYSAMSAPPLTTIDQHIMYGGEAIVDILMRKLKGEEVQSRLTPSNLIVRESTLL